MPYLEKETIRQAREMDLLTYLRRCEPNELVRVGGDVYSTRMHDSLKISNGKWYWWSRSTGGHSALDYLVAVKNQSLLEAVATIQRAQGLPDTTLDTDHRPAARKQKTSSAFTLPPAYPNSRRVFAYLCSRGIDPEIINHCVKHKLLYEEREHHNAVFVGRDTKGEARFAFLRGTLSSSTFVLDVEGSDKRFNFWLPTADAQSHTVAVYESAIDALSHATLTKMHGWSWYKVHYLALGGVSSRAIHQFLTDHPEIRKVCLCLDSDTQGRKAMQEIRAELEASSYDVATLPPKQGKDYNELLQITKGLQGRVKTRVTQARENVR